MELRDERLRGVRLLLKRDDLIHPDLAGNKWRKLKYLLADARESGASMLLTFGGAYSNHIRAVAVAGRHWGFATIGVIRGEERPFNAGLAVAIDNGMHLHYLDRASYRRKHEPAVLGQLGEVFGEFYAVPEGGTTVHAIPGCVELVDEIDEPFDVIACAVGTGGTLAGLAAGLGAGQRALGFSVLRGAASLDREVADLHLAAVGQTMDNWSIDHRFPCGGFARRTSELDRFIDEFGARHGIVLDHVYVGKMMFGLFAMVTCGEIRPGTTVVAVMTGAPPDYSARTTRPDRSIGGATRRT